MLLATITVLAMPYAMVAVAFVLIVLSERAGQTMMPLIQFICWIGAGLVAWLALAFSRAMLPC